jgi:hypothetical protein
VTCSSIATQWGFQAPLRRCMECVDLSDPTARGHDQRCRTADLGWLCKTNSANALRPPTAVHKSGATASWGMFDCGLTCATQGTRLPYYTWTAPSTPSTLLSSTCNTPCRSTFNHTETHPSSVASPRGSLPHSLIQAPHVPEPAIHTEHSHSTAESPLGLSLCSNCTQN